MLEESISAKTEMVAVVNGAALDALTEPVAKLWCRSFGVSAPAAIVRLQQRLQAKAQENLAAGVPYNRLQAKLDKAAEKIIRDWFGYVLAREIAPTSRALAIVRLAFLDCNFDGRWSQDFLNDAFCVQELASALEATMIEPTPLPARRSMTRQII